MERLLGDCNFKPSVTSKHLSADYLLTKPLRLLNKFPQPHTPTCSSSVYL